MLNILEKIYNEENKRIALIERMRTDGAKPGGEEFIQYVDFVNYVTDIEKSLKSNIKEMKCDGLYREWSDYLNMIEYHNNIIQEKMINLYDRINMQIEKE